MRVTMTEFLCNPLPYRNFLSLFGYLVLDKVFFDDELAELDAEFIDVYESFFKQNYEQITATDEYRSVHKFSAKHVRIFHDKALFRAAKHLAGPTSAYSANGFDLFVRASMWHRDIYTKLPFIKFLTYLQDSAESGEGDFLIFPGSHLAGDMFADGLAELTNWPKGSGFRRDVHMPVESDTILQEGLPYTTVPVKKGSVVVFDPRAIHGISPGASAGTNVGLHRKLIASIFHTNPADVREEFYASRGYDPKNCLAEDTFVQELGRMPYPPFFFDQASFPELEPHLRMYRELPVAVNEAYKGEGTHANAQNFDAFLRQNFRGSVNPYFD